MPSRKSAPPSSRAKKTHPASRTSTVRAAARRAGKSGIGSAPRAANARASAAKSAAKGVVGRSTKPTSPPTGRKRAAAGDEQLRDVTADIQRRYDIEDDDVPTPPSSLNLDRHASAARSGSEQMSRRKRNAVGPEITAGDVDADWQGAYFVGDEAATADNPTPGQSNVDAVGRAVGEEYQDTEELKFTDKIAKRDRHRWELDPASSEDYKARIETTKKRRG